MTRRQKFRIFYIAVVAVAVILFVRYFTNVLSFGNLLLQASSNLIIGAMLAFILNLAMDPISRLLGRVNNKIVKRFNTTISLVLTLVFAVVVIAALITLVVPNLIQATEVLVRTIPGYADRVRTFLEQVFRDYPNIVNMISTEDFNWNEIISRILDFASRGIGSVMDSTLGFLMATFNSVVNLFVIVIFAIYILSDKARFVRMYHFFTNLYLTKQATNTLTLILKTLDTTFRSFIGGELIEAVILTVMCLVGMLILRLPYATMISVLVGVINMIPMIGAFIGGGIGVFLIFTVNPTQALIFLVYLIIIQQIESNIFFPRVVGKNVGLPGIYVMMTIVIGGSLMGVAGMIIGVPLVAAFYKLAKMYFLRQAKLREEKQEEARKAIKGQ